ncbi:MAG: RHS repeat domain-containing protein, partial [Flavobacteriaceae bacterium]
VCTNDQNDTVLDSRNYAENSNLPTTDPKRMALDKATPHYNTPITVILDSLGREFRVEQLKEEDGVPLITHTEFDGLGNVLSQTDPRQFTLNQSRGQNDQVHNFRYTYDLAGNVLKTVGQDAGTTYGLINVKGNPLYTWNAREYRTKVIYDVLHRPLETLVEGPELQITAQKIVYGTDRSKNQNGQAIISYDQSGKSENLLFDFKGQLVHGTKQICLQYTSEPNWADENSVALAPEIYTSKMEYDALGRIVKGVLPDGSVQLPQYHHIGWLKGVEVRLRGAVFGTSSTEDPTVFVENITYDAKGQRKHIRYGNGVNTQYTYDEKTFRLTRILTQRQDASNVSHILQDISYVYDPMGNIIQITDNSHDRVFHAGQQVDSTMHFVYDALYQLQQASGREHLALQRNSHQQHPDVFKHTQFVQVNNAAQLANYTRNYSYDDSGNLTQIQHVGTHSFTRNMTPSQTSNRTILAEDHTTLPVEGHFDTAGNLLRLEHMAAITWNYRNHMASATIVARQVEGENGQMVDSNDAEYYVYDASGQRIRKVKETYDASGNLLWIDEKIYLGGIEIKRIYQGNAQTPREHRSTVHVMDDTKRIALVHYWEASHDTSITTRSHKIHYQLGNHLGSASLELDDRGQLISYEEYFPFGGTAYTSGESLAEVKQKEYRYTGKERDDATGLYYYGARYYVPWLGRWLNPDPAGTVDGLNLFLYVRNNPLTFIDPTGRETMTFDMFVRAPDSRLAASPRNIDLSMGGGYSRWMGEGLYGANSPNISSNVASGKTVVKLSITADVVDITDTAYGRDYTTATRNGTTKGAGMLEVMGRGSGETLKKEMTRAISTDPLTKNADVLLIRNAGGEGVHHYVVRNTDVLPSKGQVAGYIDDAGRFIKHSQGTPFSRRSSRRGSASVGGILFIAVATLDGVAIYSANSNEERFQIASGLAFSEATSYGLVKRYGGGSAFGIGIIFGIVGAAGVYKQKERAVTEFLSSEEFGHIDWASLSRSERYQIRKEAEILLFETPPMTMGEFDDRVNDEWGGTDVDIDMDESQIDPIIYESFP